MNKILIGIILLCAILTGATSFKNEGYDSKISIGSDFPIFEAKNLNGEIKIGSTEGNYIVLSFWDSKDADSRMSCKEYEKQTEKLKKEGNKVDFYAVNFDDSEALFEEIVAYDRLNAEKQFRVDATTAADLEVAFDLNKGKGTVLVAPNGKVVAFNPSYQYLQRALIYNS